MIRYLFLLLSLSSFSAIANDVEMPKEQKLAIEYMQALTSHDYASLAQFYDRESIFNDKTAEIEFVGARDIIAFFERAHRGVLAFSFEIDHMFNSDDVVVMIGSYHYKGPGKLFGKPGKVIEIMIPGVTTLAVDMDTHRVDEHIDLMDYQTMQDQLDAQ